LLFSPFPNKMILALIWLAGKIALNR